MQASVVDLRYKTSDILAALDHGEQVMLLYHGKPKATIVPLSKTVTKKVADHPFFGMYQQAEESVEDVMDKLRGGRYGF
jgi:antitoxin (DNA-binding transcriptional repressor) of toxin-antitoxin stability system